MLWDHKIVLAEDVDAFYPDSPYKNLIKFEIDIARISDSVVLFSEGFGSLAELGAFSQIDAIADRMLVIIQSRHHQKKSFIRDGPIRHLEDRDEKSVQVFDWLMVDNEGVQELDQESFRRQVGDIGDAIVRRLAAMPDMMALNIQDFGHRIIMAAAVCDVFGAATHKEVASSLQTMGVPATDDEIRRMLFCSRAVGWLRLEQRGHTKYYLPTFENHPCNFTYKAGITQKDTTRWKWDIRALWRKKEHLRSNLIADCPRGEV